jgi:hypothetical protein
VNTFLVVHTGHGRGMSRAMAATAARSAKLVTSG